METSIWIAKLTGPVILAAAVPMVLTPAMVRELANDFLVNRALIFLTGLMILVGGVAIVNVHNVWTADWRLVVTLLGWAMVIGGVARVVAPQAVARVVERILGRQPGFIRIGGGVWGLLGAALTAFGYA